MRLHRSPDNAISEEVTHFVLSLEARLKCVEAHASTMVKRDKDKIEICRGIGIRHGQT